MVEVKDLRTKGLAAHSRLAIHDVRLYSFHGIEASEVKSIDGLDSILWIPILGAYWLVFPSDWDIVKRSLLAEILGREEKFGYIKGLDTPPSEELLKHPAFIAIHLLNSLVESDFSAFFHDVEMLCGLAKPSAWISEEDETIKDEFVILWELIMESVWWVQFCWFRDFRGEHWKKVKERRWHGDKKFEKKMAAIAWRLDEVGRVLFSYQPQEKKKESGKFKINSNERRLAEAFSAYFDGRTGDARLIGQELAAHLPQNPSVRLSAMWFARLRDLEHPGTIGERANFGSCSWKTPTEQIFSWREAQFKEKLAKTMVTQEGGRSERSEMLRLLRLLEVESIRNWDVPHILQSAGMRRDLLWSTGLFKWEEKELGNIPGDWLSDGLYWSILAGESNSISSDWVKEMFSKVINILDITSNAKIEIEKLIQDLMSLPFIRRSDVFECFDKLKDAIPDKLSGYAVKWCLNHLTTVSDNNSGRAHSGLAPWALAEKFYSILSAIKLTPEIATLVYDLLEKQLKNIGFTAFSREILSLIPNLPEPERNWLMKEWIELELSSTLSLERARVIYNLAIDCDDYKELARTAFAKVNLPTARQPYQGNSDPTGFNWALFYSLRTSIEVERFGAAKNTLSGPSELPQMLQEHVTWLNSLSSRNTFSNNLRFGVYFQGFQWDRFSGMEFDTLCNEVKEVFGTKDGLFTEGEYYEILLALANMVEGGSKLMADAFVNLWIALAQPLPKPFQSYLEEEGNLDPFSPIVFRKNFQRNETLETLIVTASLVSYSIPEDSFNKMVPYIWGWIPQTFKTIPDHLFGFFFLRLLRGDLQEKDVDAPFIFLSTAISSRADDTFRRLLLGLRAALASRYPNQEYGWEKFVKTGSWQDLWNSHFLPWLKAGAVAPFPATREEAARIVSLISDKPLFGDKEITDLKEKLKNDTRRRVRDVFAS